MNQDDASQCMSAQPGCLQWWQLESLQVLFYEAKVPTSDGYITL